MMISIKSLFRKIASKLDRYKPHFHNIGSKYHNSVMYDWDDRYMIKRKCTSSVCLFWSSTPVYKKDFDAGKVSIDDMYTIDNYLARKKKTRPEYNAMLTQREWDIKDEV